MRRTITIVLALVLFAGGILPAVSVDAAATAQAGVVTTSGSRLNVRSSPSTASAVVTTLGKGSHVTLTDKTGSWWRVEYAKGKYGYCHSDYITGVSGASAIVTTRGGSLNVRSGAGTAYAVFGSLSKGETVLVLSTSGGWSRVLYHGTKAGYVSAQYLSGGSSGYTAVSLQVPNYKQTDSRWAQVKIGASGKTMAQIGCATTAIAMMESYRTGTTIYPNAMSQKLSYTSSGSVYWPSHYTVVTDSNDYLSGIYTLLKQGKPVLFGAKNAYGSQHWVVINGFTGGNLSASSFTIRDPGSNSRTTLQQFLAVYPNFYKYFHY